MNTVEVKSRNSFRRLLAFVGPAYLVSIGYMDPGNWATDIEGGAKLGRCREATCGILGALP